MMDWDGSLEQLTHSAAFPAWVAVCSAALFGLVFVLSLIRAERSVANGALAALTFTGLAVAAAIGLRSGSEPPADRGTVPSFAALPALACIDDMAGETALAACEKSLFASPETVAAAVAYTSARINRLVALGNASNRVATPDEQALRNAIERDRYGFVAYVLATRDKCQPQQCAVYAAMTDHAQVAANMDGLIYEGLVTKYAPHWSANADGLPPSVLSPSPVASGKPSTIDFPTAASIPPVSIMTEPPATRPSAAAPQPEPEANAPAAAPPAASGGPYVPAKGASAPKKRAAPKRAPASAESVTEPIQIAPATTSER